MVRARVQHGKIEHIARAVYMVKNFRVKPLPLRFRTSTFYCHANVLDGGVLLHLYLQSHHANVHHRVFVCKLKFMLFNFQKLVQNIRLILMVAFAQHL